VFNVKPHYFGIQFLVDANLVHQITSTTQLPKDVNVPYLVMPQDNTTLQQDNVNAQLIKKEPEEFGVIQTKVVNALLNYHFGMENTV